MVYTEMATPKWPRQDVLYRFFRHCKVLKNRCKQITQFIVNEEGDLLSNSKSKAEEFRKYFNKLLNSEPTVCQPEDYEGEEDINESLENGELEPSRVEI
jgi:hypothetical protein